jgi:hypothetical protein
MGVGNFTGIYQEIARELELHDYHNRDFEKTRKFSPLFDPFEVRHYYNEKLAAEGAEVLFHVDVVGVIMADGKLSAVVCNTLAGLRAFAGQVVVDCTGDARVAREAGVPIHIGRPEDGLTQPMTMMFQMQDTGHPVTQPLPPGARRYERLEDCPLPHALHWERQPAGTLLVNMTRVRGNGFDIRERSAAEREGLRQVFGVADFLRRTSHPNHVLSHVAPQIGVRETAQIEGVYRLTEDDLGQARKFDDVVAQSNYAIDVHDPTGGQGTLKKELRCYDIPYRCLVPRTGPSNLIVAGRSLSATHLAMASARVQATCMALGQAAGCAASLAIERRVALRDVPVAPLHAALAQQGVQFSR